MNRKISIGIIAAALFLFIGFFVGLHFDANRYSNFLYGFTTIRLKDDPYPLVAPLIGTDSPSALSVGHYVDMNQQIRDYVQKNPDEVDSYALYYRDLNSSLWFGINENDKYIPASLLKIALAFAVIKEEESDPQFANTEKTYTSDIAKINTSVPFLEPSELVVGHAYTTQDLLKKMLVDSDNGAKDLLYSSIDQKYFFGVFSLLGVTEPSDPLKYTLSPKDYSLFFRMLYGGTYLHNSDSERLLDILTQTTFTDGLVAGVPSEITVAHKFGTFTLTDATGAKTGIELHDCGIVYHQVNPYILCIMTKGQDAQKLAQFISDVSSIVYKNVDARTE